MLIKDKSGRSGDTPKYRTDGLFSSENRVTDERYNEWGTGSVGSGYTNGRNISGSHVASINPKWVEKIEL